MRKRPPRLIGSIRPIFNNQIEGGLGHKNIFKVIESWDNKSFKSGLVLIMKMTKINMTSGMIKMLRCQPIESDNNPQNKNNNMIPLSSVRNLYISLPTSSGRCEEEAFQVQTISRSKYKYPIITRYYIEMCNRGRRRLRKTTDP